MDLEKRINSFLELGKRIQNLTVDELDDISWRSQSSNSWFDRESVKALLEGILVYLDEHKLRKWVSAYNLNPHSEKRIGVTMAGNIPFAGFHDFLCVLISGHVLLAKLSSQDLFLPKKITELLFEIDPEFIEKIHFVDLLKEADAFIATGSNNSARYFNYYFGKKPHIIRKNRTSCAVLTGREDKNDYKLLGGDLFIYYGLGCRNVSKLFIPRDFNTDIFFEGVAGMEHIIHHHKYNNNYDYNKSIYLINQVPHLDNGFLLLKEDPQLASPISIVFYERYQDEKELEKKIAGVRDQIQCIVSKEGWFPGSIPFGTAQSPELWDYADGVDTLDFLQRL